jgi:hypothetical protein
VAGAQGAHRRRHGCGLIVAWFPKSGANWNDDRSVAAMEHVVEVNRAIRNLLRRRSYPRASARMSTPAPPTTRRAEETAPATNFTSRVNVQVLPANAELPAGEYAFQRVADTEVAVALPQVDTSAERARLAKELAEAEAHAGASGDLANETFRHGRPPTSCGQGEYPGGDALADRGPKGTDRNAVGVAGLRGRWRSRTLQSERECQRACDGAPANDRASDIAPVAHAPGSISFRANHGDRELQREDGVPLPVSLPVAGPAELA